MRKHLIKFVKLTAIAASCVYLLSLASCAFTNDTENNDNYTENYSTRYLKRNDTDSQKALIRTLTGFEMTLNLPFPLSNEEQSIYKRAIDKINSEFDCEITLKSGEYDGDKLIHDLSNHKTSNGVYYAKTDKLLYMIDNDYLCSLNNAAKSSGVDFGGAFYDKTLTGALNINYNQYGWVSQIGSHETPNCIIINKAMLIRNGMEDIIPIAKNGDWDIDTLEYYMKQTADKTDCQMIVSSPEGLFESICAAKGQPTVSLVTGNAPTIQLNNVFVTSAVGVLDSWFNIDKYCVSSAKSDDLGINDFLSEKSAFYFADSAAFSKFINARKNLDNKDDFVVVQFPNQISSHSYKNVFSPEYFAFIPQNCESDSDKILFLQNELYRELSVNSFDLFYAYIDKSIGKSACEYLFNMKYSKALNINVASFTAAYEYYASIGTNSIALSIANGTAANEALERYRQTVMRYYSDTVKKYKYTGK